MRKNSMLKAFLLLSISLFLISCDNEEENKSSLCDLNPCAESLVPNKTVCKLKGDSDYTCVCEEGYNLEGSLCIKDYCANNPCTEIEFKTVCENLNDGFNCKCDEDHELKDGICKQRGGSSCYPINPCVDDNKTKCTVTGSSDNDFSCSCDENYSLKDEVCTKTVNPCEINPCTDLNTTVCTATGEFPEDFICSCDENYSLKDEVCTKTVNPCEINPCTDINTTVCTAIGEFPEDFICSCDANYALKDEVCTEIVNPCEINLCTEANTTVCTATGQFLGDFSCSCDLGYHLKDGICVETVNPCEINPCTEENKTVCVANSQTAGDFTCECDIRYELNDGICTEREMSDGCYLPMYAFIIDNNLEGLALINKLHEITGINYNALGYSSARDELYDNVDNIDGQNQCIYTGNWYSTGSGVNCEHSWPQSRGAYGDAKSDIHHLFPTESSVNSSRGNLAFGTVADPNADYYGDCNNSSSSYYCSKRGFPTYSSYDVFEPADQHKGDIARAMFYFATRYGNREGFINSNMMREILNWHQFDPVTEREIIRNNRIEAIQNNRNPYVDCPEFIDRIDFDTVSFPENF